MTSERVIVDSNGLHFRADSFDRFGDDLCELLLSYLSFEDKIRLQSVAKQWNRLILNKQRVLVVDYEGENVENNVKQLSILSKHIQTNLSSMDPSIHRFRTIDSNRLKSLLKKCQNIRRIEFSYYHYITDEILDIICELCPRLESIGLSLDEVLLEAITRFGQRLGQRIKSIQLNKFYSEKKANLLLGFCPNLKTLKFHDKFHWVINKLNLNKLGITLEELHIFRNFVKRFDKITELAPNLKKLCFKEYEVFRNVEPIYSLPLMTNLDILEIEIKSSIPLFFSELHELVPNLKRFKLFSQIYYIPDQTLEYLSKLKSLTHLSIDGASNSITDSSVIDLLVNCNQLKRIELYFEPNITSKTIDKLIEIANKRTKEIIIFWFSRTESLPQNISLKNIPKNLKINVKIVWPKISDNSSESTSDDSNDSDIDWD